MKEWDQLRIIHLMRLLELVAELPEGEYIEMGTHYGGTAKMIFDLMPKSRHLFCFDTFNGFDAADVVEESKIRQHGFTTSSRATWPLGCAGE